MSCIIKRLITSNFKRDYPLSKVRKKNKKRKGSCSSVFVTARQIAYEWWYWSISICIKIGMVYGKQDEDPINKFLNRIHYQGITTGPALLSKQSLLWCHVANGERVHWEGDKIGLIDSKGKNDSLENADVFDLLSLHVSSCSGLKRTLVFPVLRHKIIETKALNIKKKPWQSNRFHCSKDNSRTGCNYRQIMRNRLFYKFPHIQTLLYNEKS